MKKVVIRVTVLLIAFTFFTACSREEFMDLYGFTDRFTYTEISPDDFYADETVDGKKAYHCYFEKENPKLMLKLISAENNKIGEVRIYLPKYDENGKRASVQTEDILLFTDIVSSSVCAFTGWSKTDADEILNQMLLYEKKSYENMGELTKTKDSFHFIYHSSAQGSEFIIYNTYLKEIPQTEKPESKPMYGDTTKIRTETVPTK